MAQPVAIRGRHAGARLGIASLYCLACTAMAAPDLRSLDLEDLLKVRVVGAAKYEQAQSEAPAAIAVITRAEISRFGWRTLGAALRSLPGVYTSFDRQYEQVGTRGLGLPGDFNTRLLITINGNRLNDPLFDASPSGRDFPLDMDLIERIEFIPGPGSAIYGQNAMFGVVNIVTRRGMNLAGTEASASHQTLQRQTEGRLTWGGKLDNDLDVLLSVSGMRANGQDLPMSYGASGISGVARGMDGENTIQAFAQASLGAWQFEWTHGTRRKDDPTGAYLSDPLLRGQYERDTYSLGQLRYDSSLGQGWNVAGRLFGGFERYDSTLSYGARLHETAASNWWGTEWQLSTTLGNSHHLLLGLEYQDNALIEQTLEDAARPTNDFRIESPSHRLGAYAQDEWQLTPKISATLGLRADHNAKGGTSANPRAALVWQTTGRTTIKALLGTAHRQPNAYESNYEDGLSITANPQLRRENIKTAELVADYRVSENLQLHATSYRWLLNNVIRLGKEGNGELSRYQNGISIHAEGVEFGADRSWENGVRLRGNVSFANEAMGDNSTPVNSPRWLARALLSSPLPARGLHLAYELRYDDRRHTYAGTYTGGRLVADLRLSTSTLLPSTEVSLKASNLFDRHYADPAGDTNWQSSIDQDRRSLAIQVLTRF